MGDKRNTRKPKAPSKRAPAKFKPLKLVTMPSRSLSTRKRKLSVKAAASNTGRKKPAYLQPDLVDEGVSQDDIAEDILADLECTPSDHDSSKQVSEDEFEEFDMRSDGDEHDSEEDASESLARIEFKRKKSNNQTRGGMLAILSHWWKGLILWDFSGGSYVQIINIPFEVPYDGRYKEMTISSKASWSVAQVAIGKRMAHNPVSLSLGYINPFKAQKSGKPVLMSLETEDELDGLIGHVNTFLKEQQ